MGVQLLDIYKDDCIPCKMLSPIIDELADELQDRVSVSKVNVKDLSDAFLDEHNILGAPTILIFVDDVCVYRGSGYHPKEKLMAILEEYI